MKILGINDAHDAGAVVIDDDNILAAVNEERLNRIKLCWGFPKQSIDCVMHIAKLEPKDIDLIAVASVRNIWVPGAISYNDVAVKVLGTIKQTSAFMNKIAIKFLTKQFWIPLQRTIELPLTIKRRKAIKACLKSHGFECPAVFVDHHIAHAASAYYIGGKESATIITSDSTGDCLSSIVWHCVWKSYRFETGHV